MKMIIIRQPCEKKLILQLNINFVCGARLKQVSRKRDLNKMKCRIIFGIDIVYSLYLYRQYKMRNILSKKKGVYRYIFLFLSFFLIAEILIFSLVWRTNVRKFWMAYKKLTWKCVLAYRFQSRYIFHCPQRNR